MSLTMLKYNKSGANDVPTTPSVLIKKKVLPQQQQQILKKPLIKLDSGLIINKIPAVKAVMKRASSGINAEPANKKLTLQTIASTGTPLTSYQWQPTTIGGAGGTTITPTSATKKSLGAVLSSLPPNTIVQARSVSNTNNDGTTAYVQTNGGSGITLTPTVGSSSSFHAITSQSNNTIQVRRPTILLKQNIPKRTIRSVTLELIEKNPFVHLGVSANRLPLLKNVICATADVSLVACYITLKKLRQNEEFALLGEYFEISEAEAQQIFARSIVKLARFMRFLVRWPDSKKYYDRHKNLPFAFRSSLSHVQSLIDCVETEMHRPMQIDCSNFKFILSITPNGIISYVSDAFVGHHDDLTIFTAANFQAHIPKYLSLVVDPGKAIRRKRKPKRQVDQQASGGTGIADTDSTTDSADESAEDIETDDTDDGRPLSRYAASRVAAELASHQTLNIVNSALESRKVKDFSIPTMRVREPVCRLQIRHMIYCLREFKILQPYAIQEPLLFQYLNEILQVTAALTNLQR